MTKKKTSSNPTTTVVVEGISVTVPLDEDPTFTGLHASLTQVNKISGVKGYILRNRTKAVIELQNPAKILDYALLLSEATEANEKISKLFHLNVTKSVVEGSEIKMLCATVGENRLGIFMDKSLDHMDIFRQISP